MHLVVGQRSFKRSWPLIALVLGSVFEYRIGRSPSVTVLELVSLAVLAQIFLDKVALGAVIDRQFFSALSSSRRMVVLYCWIFISALAAIAFRENLLNFWLFRDYFPSVVIVLVFGFYPQTRDELDRLLIVYLCGVVVVALLAASQGLFGQPYPRAYHAVTDAKMDLDGKVIVGVYKATGLFAHPNALGAFLLLPIAIMSAKIRESAGGMFLRLIYFAGLILLLGALAGTYSKGAWVWAAVIVFLVVFAPKAAFGQWWIPLLVAAVVSNILLFGSIYLADHGYRAFYTMLTRVGLWQAAWSIVESDWYVWVLGNGQYLMPWISSRFSDISYPNAHSSLLDLVLFFGVLGVIFFIGVVISAYASVCRFASGVGRNWRISWVFVVAIPVYCLYFIFEPHLEDGGNLAQFFLMIGFCEAFGQLQRQSGHCIESGAA